MANESRKLVVYNKVGEMTTDIQFPTRGWLYAKGDTTKGVSPAEWLNLAEVVASAKAMQTKGNVYFSEAKHSGVIEL